MWIGSVNNHHRKRKVTASHSKSPWNEEVHKRQKVFEILLLRHQTEIRLKIVAELSAGIVPHVYPSLGLFKQDISDMIDEQLWPFQINFQIVEIWLAWGVLVTEALVRESNNRIFALVFNFPLNIYIKLEKREILHQNYFREIKYLVTYF